MDARTISEKAHADTTFATLEVPSELRLHDYFERVPRRGEERQRLRSALRKTGVVHPVVLAVDPTSPDDVVILDGATRVELLREEYRANPLPNYKHYRAVVLPGFAPAGLHATALMDEALMRTYGLVRGVAALGRITPEQALQLLQDAIRQASKLRLGGEEPIDEIQTFWTDVVGSRIWEGPPPDVDALRELPLLLEALGRPDWLAYLYAQMRLLFLPWELIREVVRHRGTAAHAFVLRDAYRLLPKEAVDPYLEKLQELRPGTLAVALGITTPQRYPAEVRELAKELRRLNKLLRDRGTALRQSPLFEEVYRRVKELEELLASVKP